MSPPPASAPRPAAAGNPFAVLGGPAPVSSGTRRVPTRRFPGWAGVGAAALLAGLWIWRSLPPTPGTEPVRVEANRPWQDSGLEVRAGDEIVIQVRGQWRREGLSWCDGGGNEKAPRTRAVLPDAPAM